MIDDNDSLWARGINWMYSMWEPTFFLVQGEIIYVFMLWFFFPSWKTVKVALIIIVISLVAKMLGYDMGGLFRRFNRWRIGSKRSLYGSDTNLKRLLRGI